MKTKIITLVFLIIILIMSIFIDIVDILDVRINTITIKYIGIILCFLYTLINIKNKRKYLISIALFFTLIADYFLLVIDKYYALGVSIFIIVQLMYLLYLSNFKINYKDIILRVGTYLVVCIILIVSKEKDVVSYLSAFYFINLVFNIIKAFIHKDEYLILAIGLLLFSFCDICVGTYNILFNLNKVQNMLYYFVENGMWLFYLPSQAIIAYSTYERGDSSEK